MKIMYYTRRPLASLLAMCLIIMLSCKKVDTTVSPFGTADLLVRTWQLGEVSASGNKGKGSTVSPGSAAYNDVFDGTVLYRFETGNKATLSDGAKKIVGTWSLLNNNSQLEIKAVDGTLTYTERWEIKSVSAESLALGVTINDKNGGSYNELFAFTVASIANALGVDASAIEVTVDYKFTSK